jgi:hypothetical protein
MLIHAHASTQTRHISIRPYSLLRRPLRCSSTTTRTLAGPRLRTPRRRYVRLASTLHSQHRSLAARDHNCFELPVDSCHLLANFSLWRVEHLLIFPRQAVRTLTTTTNMRSSGRLRHQAQGVSTFQSQRKPDTVSRVRSLKNNFPTQEDGNDHPGPVQRLHRAIQSVFRAICGAICSCQISRVCRKYVFPQRCEHLLILNNSDHHHHSSSIIGWWWWCLLHSLARGGGMIHPSPHLCTTTSSKRTHHLPRGGGTIHPLLHCGCPPLK